MLNKFTNQELCYWLQGYFEISTHPLFTQEHAKSIIKTIDNVAEPLGVFTEWLKKLLTAVISEGNHPSLLSAMQPLIQSELNSIFLHVIDNSYDTSHTSDYLQHVHDGTNSPSTEK